MVRHLLWARALLGKQVFLLKFSQQFREIFLIHIFPMSTSKTGKVQYAAAIHTVSHWALDGERFIQRLYLSMTIHTCDSLSDVFA